MHTISTIAWRNIWRNKQRTLITMASIFLAVFLALLMRSWQLGSYRKMVRDVVGSYSGYIQIHGAGYWGNKTLDYSFAASDTLAALLHSTKGVAGLVPRLESFALASGMEQTKGAMVVGIDPEAEQGLTRLADRIVKGEYVASNNSGLLIAEKLAEFLKLGVNDTLVLLGQGFHGVGAADKYPIKGLLHFASPLLNGQLVYMPLEQCQSFYSAENRLTSLALDLERPEDTIPLTAALRMRLAPSHYEVMPWDEMQVELLQQIESDNASGLIMLGILYMIVAFGIFGTLMMMINERRREFGVMLALGMKKRRLMGMIGIETLIMTVMSIILGCLASVPIIYYYTVHPPRFSGEMARAIENFGVEPVLPFLLESSIFINQAWTVLLLTAVAAAYPLYTIIKLKVVEALHH